jgi:uncharacterized membrane protein
MVNEDLRAIGRLNIVLTDEQGNVKDTREVDNLVVDTGRTHIASRMVGVAQSVMTHMGIGTGAVAAAAGNTTLGSEVGTRVALSTYTNASQVVTAITTFPTSNPATSQAITEAGIFNASTGGIMLCRTVFSAINKDPTDTLQITWTITVNAP